MADRKPQRTMTNRMHWLLKTQFFWLTLAVGAVVAFRASLLTWRPSLLLVAAAVGGLVLTGFGSLLVVFVRLRSGRRGGGKSLLVSVGLALPVLIGVLLFGIQAKKVPPIHDITTDLVHPPPFRAAQILRQPGDNPVVYPGEPTADQQRQAYPDIVPLEVTLPPAGAFDHSVAIARRLGWRIVGQDREQGLVEAIDRTLFFGFTDDIVIRIGPGPVGSRIDLRSASRAGVSDLGVNAKRIRSFVAAFHSPPTN